MAETIITNDNFEAEVVDSELPVVVDFWAEWCTPCRMLAPELAAFAEENEGTVKVCKVNVDEVPEIAKKYNILSIPTILVFSGGELVKTSVGFIRKKDIEKLVNSE